MIDISGNIQLFIDDVEYDFQNKFEFYFHPTNFSWMKFFEVIPKNNNFYPKNTHYQKCEREFTFAKVLKNNEVIFFGIINKTGRYSLMPNQLKTKAVEICDYRKWLSVSKNIDKIFFNKKPKEIVSEVVNVLNEPRIKIGSLNFTNDDFIKAYSLTNKNAYQILKDVIPNLTNSILVFKNEGEFVSINYKSNQELKQNISPIILDFENIDFFSQYKILDINYENDTSNYANSITCTSNNLLSQKPTDNKILIIESDVLVLSNNIDKIVNEKEFTYIKNQKGEIITLDIKNKSKLSDGEYFDLAYDLGKNTIEINNKFLKQNNILNIRYYSKQTLTITSNNYSEIDKLKSISGTSGIVSRTEKFNDYSNIDDLYRVLNTQLEKNSIEKSTLILKSNKKIWNLLDVVNVKNYSEEINGIYLVHEISGRGSAWISGELIEYEYLLKKTFITDNIVNLFDSQSFRDNPAYDENNVLETTETIGKDIFFEWNTELSEIVKYESFFKKNLLQKDLQGAFLPAKFLDILEIKNE